MDRPLRLSDDEYPRRVEARTRGAGVRRRLTFSPEDDDQSPLQQAVNELGRNLRHVHHEGDGCLEEDEG